MKQRLHHSLAALFIGAAALAQPVMAEGGYVAGDFHQHTTYTDGSYTIGKMMEMNNKFGLDWWANSEHGGAFATWGLVTGTDLGSSVTWANTGISLLGKANSSKMWRWQSIRDWSFRDVQLWRRVFPDKLIIQGYEMNVPGHEHASMAIIANQFDANPNANPVAQFEYMFDNNDADDTEPNGWIKSTKSGHTKAIEAVTWLQNNYPTQSWLIPAHPERYIYNGSTGWNIEHLRDLNNAGPDVFFGFESMPGHQQSAKRGEYGSNRPSYGTDTYGGTGLMAAKVGGLWDALLSEGRRFWLFGNSDCHDNSSNDFFPGEYQKNYTYVAEKKNAQAVVDGLRSGNTFVVMGDLIDALDFRIGEASMGSLHQSADGQITISIRLHDPVGANFNHYSSYTNPELDHIDIIAGTVGSKIDPTNTTEYTKDNVSTTKVIARFGKSPYTDAKGIVTQTWTDEGDGWKNMSLTYTIPAGTKMYFRLRGSNNALNSSEIDNEGNPLIDEEGTNNAAKAFADLWVYTNPVYAENTTPKLTTGAAENKTSPVRIYPNPATEVLNISFAEPQNGEISLYDMTGKAIAKSTLKGETVRQIPTKGLAKGIYTINANGSIQKVAIQ